MENASSHKGLTPEQWVTAINRLPVKQDLPLTLCGGEPTIYYNGNGLNYILDHTEHYYDLLTNMGHMKFFKNLGSNVKKLQRNSPYPSIRVSWHEEEMNRTWSNGFEELVSRCKQLEDYGFEVSPEQSKSDVGIYMVEFPTNHTPEGAENCPVPFETKEFLGIYDGKLYGTYAYPHSTDLVKSGIWPTTLECDCQTNELLIDSFGFIWSCHNYLYNSYIGKGLSE